MHLGEFLAWLGADGSSDGELSCLARCSDDSGGSVSSVGKASCRSHIYPHLRAGYVYVSSPDVNDVIFRHGNFLLPMTLQTRFEFVMVLFLSMTRAVSDGVDLCSISRPQTTRCISLCVCRTSCVFALVPLVSGTSIRLSRRDATIYRRNRMLLYYNAGSVFVVARSTHSALDSIGLHTRPSHPSSDLWYQEYLTPSSRMSYDSGGSVSAVVCEHMCSSVGRLRPSVFGMTLYLFI